MDTLELIKDVCLFGGTVPKERAEEVRVFLDNIKKQTQTLSQHDLVICGFYWVRQRKDTEFEAAKCDKSRVHFCFTSGSIMRIDKVYEIKSLNNDIR